MATYFLRVSKLSRGRGARVTRAAAYRAGERIHDERSSDVYNFSSRQDIAYKEVVLPSDLDDDPDMAWARNRATLWNAVEHAASRRNSLLAREYLVLLPPELTTIQRVALVRTFSQELADRYRNAVDCVIHYPRPGSDSRHHHAHVLMTTREVGPKGVGARTTLELAGTERHALGLGPSKDEYLQTRERWAQLTNEALAKAGAAERVDQRSLRAQGIDREPEAAIPQKVYYAERKSGTRTHAGDEIRARQRERAEALALGADKYVQVLRQQKATARDRAQESANGRQRDPKRPPRSTLTREELNERRRARYHANAEGLNQKRRERYRENAESERQKYRQWRRANAPEVNERRRKWRAANVERVNQRAREYRAKHAERESAARWLRMREKEKDAERTVSNGSSYESTARLESASRPDEALEDARKWLEVRERAGNAEQPDPTSEPGGYVVEGDLDEDDEEDAHRTKDTDLGL